MMTAYTRKKLMRRYAREIKAVEHLAEQGAQLSAALLMEKYEWSRTKATEVLEVCEWLELLKAEPK